MMRKHLVGTVATASLLVGIPAAQADLILRYSFDEASSGTTTALDTGTGDPANGTFNGATRTSDTPGGTSLGALDLTGAPNPLTTPFNVDGGNATKLDNLAAITLTAWIKVPTGMTINNGDRIMGRIASGTGPGFDFRLGIGASGTASASNLILDFSVNGTAGSPNSGVGVDANDKWAFVAVTYDGDTRTFYWGNESTAVNILGTTATFERGASGAVTAPFLVGDTAATTSDRTPPAYIDDVRVYDTVLSLGDLESVRMSNVPEPVGLGAMLLAGMLGLRRRKLA